MNILGTVAIVLILALTAEGRGEEVQRVAIPQLMPERGVLPSFKILEDGNQIGRLRSDAVLSNGRFFGLRWIAEPQEGRRAQVKDGDPNTLHVWTTGSIQLLKE